MENFSFYAFVYLINLFCWGSFIKFYAISELK